MSSITSVHLCIHGRLFKLPQLTYCGDIPWDFVDESLFVKSNEVFTFYKEEKWSEERKYEA